MSAHSTDDIDRLRDDNAALRARVAELEDRLRGQDAIRSEAETLRLIVDTIPAYVSYIGADLRYRLVNRPYTEWFCRPREAIEGRSVLEVQGPENFAAISASMERAARGEEVRYQVPMTDGHGGLSRVFDTRYQPRRHPDGSVDGFFVLSMDVTAERQAAEALRLIQFAVDHAAEAMYTIDPDGRFLAVNDTACQRLEYTREELLGRSIPDIDPDCPGERWPGLWRDLQRAGRSVGEARHRSKSGRVMAVEISAALFVFEGREYCCAFVRDITQRRAEEERLRQSQRLAAIGTLAAGIAHEINNPLGLILLEAQDALSWRGDRAELDAALGSIVTNVQRCASIVKGVLQFARQRTWEKGPFDVNRALRRAVELTAEPARRAGVAIDLELEEPLPPVLGNATAIEQVVINLIQNAARASAPGGRIVVGSHREAAALCLRVRDAGRGMTEEEQRRAFDPFYSTHYSTGGTGLGLSIAHGIVEDHRGTIDIESAPGAGSTLSVRLPIADLPAGAREPAGRSGDGPRAAGR